MERIDRDRYRLSTGREVAANRGLISLARDVALGERYVGPFTVDDDADAWTAQELEELADFMIEQWQLFRSAICDAIDHDWSPWRGGFSDPFGIKGGTKYFQHRNCRRCQASEELPDR